MTWHTGEALWLLALLPCIAGLLTWGWRLRERGNRRFLDVEAAPRGDTAARPAMITGSSGGMRAARGVLLIVGLALTIVALARPQYGSRTRLLRKRGVDLVLVLDFSKSMLARDVRPSRIDRAVAEVQAFLGELGGDRVGMVAFAGETMQFPMTTDYAAAGLFLRDLRPHDLPVGGTAIGRALAAARQLLERSKPGDTGEAHGRAQVVVLMTDGEDHEGDPVAAARELAEQGAKLFVVGIGSRTGEPIPTYASDGTWTGYVRDADGEPVLSALTAQNEAQLREIAEVTGGKYIRAKRGSVGMDAIRREMRHMKQTELEARKVTVHEERYAVVLLVGFLLILLEALLPDTRPLFRRTS